MAFPDWVEKYRSKGKAINYVNGKFYLYEVHSERIKGTNKVKKINDKYLGKITEDGLIPPKSKIKGDIICKEYGIYAFVLSLNDITVRRIIKDFPGSYKEIITTSLIKLVHGDFQFKYYENSYMSVIYPNIDMNTQNQDILLTIERLTNMFKSNLLKHNIELKDYYILLKNVNMVQVNGEWVLTQIPKSAQEIIDEYQINLRGVLCQE